MNWNCRILYLLVMLTLAAPHALAQARRKIIIDEDCSGPAGSNLQTLALLIQSPQVEVLGITVSSGDQWRDEELAHTLRFLEIMDRTDVPVFSGAAFPLVRTREETLLWQERYGKVSYAGAWDARWYHDPFLVPPMAEGQPTAKASTEDAIHFLLRMVHQFPNEVTIYEGAPMTNLALALSIDPQFAGLARDLVFMGGSLNPDTAYPEFSNNPRHEFNFWFDPEAAAIVLRAPWKRIVCTPTDVSIKARFSPAMVKQIAASATPLARYLTKFYVPGEGNDYMWDELAAAAWLDPSLITRRETRYMGVDIDHGSGYGNTLTWTAKDDLKVTTQPVEIQMDLDAPKFYDMFVRLMSAPLHTAAH
jgi:inosine-uridine nucleoside N-ribohydrolase